MTGKEYQKKAMEHKLMDDSNSKIDILIHSLFGLNSKVGNCSELIQRTYQGENFDRQELLNELSDVLWMLSEACYSLNIDLDYLMEFGISKNQDSVKKQPSAPVKVQQKPEEDDMEVILYSTNCPKCKVLESKLNDKGIKFEISNNIDAVIEAGFMSAPVLQVDMQLMNFSDAIKWINNH